jgi:hypothetical protein
MAGFLTTPAFLVFSLKILESGTGNKYLVVAQNKSYTWRYVCTRKVSVRIGLFTVDLVNDCLQMEWTPPSLKPASRCHS